VLDAVVSRSTSHDSYLHGLSHWERVGRNGHDLAAETAGADPDVVLLFALFHDSMRLNDGHDPEHGQRGGALAHELRKLLALDDDQLALLQVACAGHTDGLTSTDPTIGACWDADRLDLPRVGTTPIAALMSTDAGRRPCSRQGVG
jgi:uncharacterized protein